MIVHDSIFGYKLAPNALKTYLYLTCCKNCLGTAAVKVKTIAEKCGMSSLATVHTALAELERKGLVTKYRRKNTEGNIIANGYHVKQLAGKWFVLPASGNALRLPKSTFVTYLYLCKCANRKRRAFPSLSTLARVLRISRNTVIEAIRHLVALRLVHKAQRWPGKHNLYTLQGNLDQPAAQTKKNGTAPTLCRPIESENCATNFRTTIIAATKGVVKRFCGYFAKVHNWFWDGWCKNQSAVIDPPGKH